MRLLVLVATALTLPLSATTILLGNNPVAGQCVINFDSGSPGPLQTGQTVGGGQCTPAQTVQFSTLTSQTLEVQGGGNARIEDAGGDPLTSIAIQMPGFYIDNLVFNLQVGGGVSSGATATIRALSPTDTVLATLVETLGPGQNFFTVSAMGHTVASVEVTTTGGGFRAFQQPRIAFTAIPEPSGLLLAALGCGSLLLARRLRLAR